MIGLMQAPFLLDSTPNSIEGFSQSDCVKGLIALGCAWSVLAEGVGEGGTESQTVMRAVEREAFRSWNKC